MQRDLVLVHGMFMNPRCWSGWSRFFSERGYTCHAPAWPFHDGEPAALRAHPPEGLGALTLGQVVDAVGAFIDALGTKPAVVGHSMGGLVAQRMLATGRARAAVCIDSAAPRGVTTPSWSFLRSNLPVVNPFAGDAPYTMSREHFRYTFCHTMTREASAAVYEAHVVPESRNVARSSGGADGAIDFKKPHPPILFVAGERDHIIPAALNRKNHAAYADPASRRDFTVFTDRTHWICGQDGWEEVAQYVDGWLTDVAQTAPK